MCAVLELVTACSPCFYFVILQGQNLILNMNDHGFVVCAYNRTVAKVDSFLANEAKGVQNMSLYLPQVSQIPLFPFSLSPSLPPFLPLSQAPR